MSAMHGALCDRFLFSSRLILKMDLAATRETVLHFFDRIRKDAPALRHLRRRHENTFVLEETDDAESRKWLRLESSGLRLGYSDPPSLAAARSFGALVFENAPYFLTLSELDYDHLEVVYCFDLHYAGNHDELVAETFFADHPFASLLLNDRARHIIDCQPFFGVALNEMCDQQAYLEVKGRSTTFEVRTGRYEPQPLSVLLTMRKYWGYGEPVSLAKAFEQLCDGADGLAAEKIVPIVVNRLAEAIAGRP